jgi:hypothetical protein
MAHSNENDQQGRGGDGTITAALIGVGVAALIIGAAILFFLSRVFRTSEEPFGADTSVGESIDTMDSTAGWTLYLDEVGSSGSINAQPGQDGDALEIIFDVVADGWVGVSRVVDPSALADSEGITFAYRGSGEPNTFEFKLLCAPDENEQSAIFGIQWTGSSVTDGWTRREVRYRDLACWPDTPCEEGELVDPERVWKIDFAVSSKPGDSPGVGVVLIDDVRAIK